MSSVSLEQLAARFAIQDALAVYCRGIDRLDPALIAAAYWPDASEDHGIFKGMAQEFVPWIVTFLEQTYVATAHRLGQSSVRIAGSRASAETYFSSVHRRRTTGLANFEAVDGRYVDEFQKRGDEWRISSRVVVLDFVRELEVSETDIARIPGLTFGARGVSDLSYATLAGVNS